MYVTSVMSFMKPNFIHLKLKINHSWLLATNGSRTLVSKSKVLLVTQFVPQHQTDQAVGEVVLGVSTA